MAGKLISGVAIIVAVLIGKVFGSIIGGAAGEKQSPTLTGEKLYSHLANTARQTNQSLPMMVDDETRLDIVTTDKNLVQYRYTLVDIEVSEEVKRIAQIELLPTVGSKVCTTKETRSMLENAISLGFYYNDMNAHPILDFEFSISDCKHYEGITFD